MSACPSNDLPSRSHCEEVGGVPLPAKAIQVLSEDREGILPSIQDHLDRNTIKREQVCHCLLPREAIVIDGYI